MRIVENQICVSGAIVVIRPNGRDTPIVPNVDIGSGVSQHSLTQNIELIKSLGLPALQASV